MLPGPAIFVLFVASQIYIHLASSSYALTAREAIGKALGRGFMKGLGKLILGIVSSFVVYLVCVEAVELTGVEHL
jgi:phosphopantetheinyl transferase